MKKLPPAAWKRMLPYAARRKLPRVIKVVEVSEKEARRLNRAYRKKDYAANVLSFRYGPDYGEIVACPVVIRREAKAQGNAYRYQMTWMVLHGMMHLAGFHHERSPEIAGRVAKLEKDILRKLYPAK